MSNICTALVQSGILDMTYSVNISYNKSTSTLYAAVFTSWTRWTVLL